MQKQKIVKEQDAVSNLQIRKLIGLISILLPFVLVIGDCLIFKEFRILSSISDYYYSDMRNFYFGLLLTLAVFFCQSIFSTTAMLPSLQFLKLSMSYSTNFPQTFTFSAAFGLPSLLIGVGPKNKHNTFIGG